MTNEFDIDEIRERLKDYYGTAMFNGNPIAMVDLEKIKYMSDEEIIEEASSIGIV